MTSIPNSLLVLGKCDHLRLPQQQYGKVIGGNSVHEQPALEQPVCSNVWTLELTPRMCVGLCCAASSRLRTATERAPLLPGRTDRQAKQKKRIWPEQMRVGLDSGEDRQRLCRIPHILHDTTDSVAIQSRDTYTSPHWRDTGQEEPDMGAMLGKKQATRSSPRGTRKNSCAFFIVRLLH